MMRLETITGEYRPDRVIPLREAARIAALSIDALKRRNKAGKLKIVHLAANRLGIRESELERFLSELER
jgi:predicted site-specific integrase-resolvase